MAYRLRLPRTWLIHNAFHVSLIKPNKGDPLTQPITKETSNFEDQEEILQLKSILRYEDKILRSGKVIRDLVKYKNYPFSRYMVNARNPTKG